MTRSAGGLHSSLMAPQPWPCSPGPAALALQPWPQCLAVLPGPAALAPLPAWPRCPGPAALAPQPQHCLAPQPWPHCPGPTALALQPWPRSPGPAALAPQPWSHSPSLPYPAALAPLSWPRCPSTAWPWSHSFSSLGEDSSVSHPGKHLVMEGDTCSWGAVSPEVCGGAILPVSQPQVKDRVSFPILEEVSSSCSWTGISGGSFLQLGVFIAILSCFLL